MAPHRFILGEGFRGEGELNGLLVISGCLSYLL